MGEQLNQNLAMLRSTFGAGRLFAPAEGDVFTVDGVEFICDYAPGSTAERFFIVKQAAHVRQYRELCRRFRGGNIVELGIAEGGVERRSRPSRPNRLASWPSTSSPVRSPRCPR